MHLTRASLATYMDHTLLKPEATAVDIDRRCLRFEQRVVHVCGERGAGEVHCGPFIWVRLW